MRGKLLRVVHSMTMWRDLLAYSRILKCSIPKWKNLASNLIRRNFLDPGHLMQLSQHPGARLLLPLLPSHAMADLA
ncbi:hypothetical protein T08_16773 [Trichinella sp. T8]|nr:hypothetical protein T08_16773 [Trichinella sp. T8]